MIAFKSAMARLPATALALSLAACTVAAQAAPYVMFRDPGCGCCHEWAEHIRADMQAEVVMREDVPMTQVKADRGIPADLASCHTMEVEGYVIEGHVPAADIRRLLRERPEGVRGLAVAGMPLGSPGMEMGGRTQPYKVIAFGDFGQRVFATYQ
ncbi:DUF411 domain-containing protein [Croceicoccus naphthovorans]|uniref:Metal-binding protein n=1 Tax=Croceicoccus naphthovorans TaxID=1348774 RepID=A0A0G3XK19_9SPHN|nr:DUF411 domain-containing protein [Croceicoccus naphthovorans]AKM11522.1 metal-binding protein [Croceicoccus naphthovorans]MBB3990234.1 hypothetical protein [Croceicoccus naphthovorans]